MASVKSVLILDDKMSTPLKSIEQHLLANTQAMERLEKSYSKTTTATNQQIEANKNAVRGFESLEGGITSANAAMNLINQGMNLFKSAISEMERLTGIYLDSQQAGTKLTTVMRNMMGATDAQVESLNQLAIAQSKVGVVSANAQKTAMAEIASFVEYQSSIERILPTMNNYIAYQYGTTASMEQARNVATSLGKAIMGSIDGLAKQGFTLSDNEKEWFKTANEMERVQFVIDMIDESMAGMNEALGRTDAGRIAQLRNEIELAEQALGEQLLPVQLQWQQMTLGSLIPALSFVSENLHIIIPALKTVGVAMVYMAAQQIPGLIVQFMSLIAAHKTLIIQAGLFTAAFMLGTTMMRSSNPVIKVLGGALTGLAVGLGIATVATKLFNTTLMANPIFAAAALIVGAIVGVATALGAFGSDMAETTTDADIMNQSMTDMQNMLDGVGNYADDTSDSFDDLNRQFKTYAEIQSGVLQNANKWDLTANRVKDLGQQFFSLMDIQNRTESQELMLQKVIKELDGDMVGFEQKINNLTNAHGYERKEIENLINSYIRLAEVRAKGTAYSEIQAGIYKEQYNYEQSMRSVLGEQYTQAGLTTAYSQYGSNINFYGNKMQELEAQKMDAIFEGITIPVNAFRHTNGQTDMEKTPQEMISGQHYYGIADRVSSVTADYDQQIAGYQQKLDEATTFQSQIAEYIAQGQEYDEELLRLTKLMTDLLGEDNELTKMFAENGLDVSSGSLNSVKEVGRVKEPLTIKEEDLRALHDISTRNVAFQYQQVTPQLTISNMQVRETVDVDQVFDALADGVESIMSSQLVGVPG